MKDRINDITDLLLGAAHADDELRGEETATVRKLLTEVMGEELPEEVDERIDRFSPASFDLAAAARSFAGDSIDNKRHLLELVARVTEADEEIELAEDEYLRNLAKALDLDASQISDLVLDYEVEELRDGFDELRGVDVDVDD